MFTDIFYTFFQFLPVFFLFIVAFAFAFYALFQNQVRVCVRGYACVVVRRKSAQ